ncbi:MAG TPA: UDP-2,3-diacylglucosamine diphosphatase [Phycisphaerales bacterium]|nr:UDP-2,3-diacylglucosamine diphosphatase [Phycisphaerales bacterium]
MALEYRTVFISDTHLGFRGTRSRELSAFLKHVRCERLYLVGDIIDFWALKQRWHWPLMHNQVIRRILKTTRRGTTVVYIPGNHDDALRQYAGFDVGGVTVARQAVHRTADGRSLLITHGDEYDMVVKHSKFLSMLGSWAYDHLVNLNRAANVVRKFLGRPPWSFSKYLKLRVKSACTFISNFEQHLLTEAQRRGLDGVVCGHIHVAALRDETLTEGGKTLTYANCGDWIEHPSALVEHADGRLELVDVERVLADAGIAVDTAEPEHVELDPRINFDPHLGLELAT